MLEDLDLSWCRGITGAAVGMLADACPNLRRLRLFGCTQVPLPLSALLAECLACTSRSDALVQLQVERQVLLGHSNEELAVTGAPAAKVDVAETAKIKLIESEA